jgi:hypothetical protein
VVAVHHWMPHGALAVSTSTPLPLQGHGVDLLLPRMQRKQ